MEPLVGVGSATTTANRLDGTFQRPGIRSTNGPGPAGGAGAGDGNGLATGRPRHLRLGYWPFGMK